MFGLFGLIALLALPALAALIGTSFAEDKGEETLFWKLYGYGFLGFFTFRLNGFPLPVGFVLALILANRAERNQSARRTAATVTFIFFLLGLFLGGCNL